MLGACGKNDGTNYVPPTAGKPASAAATALSSTFELTPETTATLLPHTEGSTWTYSLDIQQQRTGQAAASTTSEVTYKIDAAKKKDDATQFLFGIYREGKKTDEQMWSASPKGIYQLSLGPERRPFDPPQPVVTFPVKNGELFKWNGKTRAANGRNVETKLEGAPVGTQSVDTAMGQAFALLIETQSVFDVTAKDGKVAKALTITDCWLRPKVGIVRYRQTTRAGDVAVVYTLRLKSYKIN